ncbi:FkbM family methyltransferase [Methylophilaceae bacterium]|nr:FkbM family methyltransferase [Methylophilaceae bacterium]MDC1173011.1 FkbM family methyltransferase [Methylophilaceae bacterium]|tara:strand:- start:157 stop:828 length:672 start_codon:yes stop_codon:yes gene_type:complete
MNNKKLVYGWWLPEEDKHFEAYFAKFPLEVDGRRIYQRKHLDRSFHHIKNNPFIGQRTAIDIGGHCGFWSYYLGGNFKKVYAFEPVSIFSECFKKNVPFKNVELIPVALGNENKFISMDIDLKNTGMTHVSNQLDEKNKVELKKIDDYEFTDVDFIKIDVEGFENQVVLGAKNTLIKNKPIIIIEQKGHSEYFNEKLFQAIETLNSYGAKVIEQVNKDYIMSW